MIIRSDIKHRRDALAELDRSISKLCAMVIAQPIYVDTVQALVRPFLTGHEIALLASLNRTPHLRLHACKRLWVRVEKELSRAENRQQ